MPAWMDEDLEDRRRRGLYRARRALQSGQGAHVRLAGRDLVNFASNDYLNLAADLRLARAAARAARRYGTGAGASPLVSGRLPPLRALERDLARWEQTEAALVFSSGFAANLAVVATLAARPDAVFSDAANHASLIDGCRLSGARVHVYRHLDLDHLASLLAAEGGKARRRLLVSDSVFSMDGDFAPVRELLQLADRFDALLVLDEAHATGVLGEQGRGLTDDLTPADRGSDRLVKVGTLSKALGSQGGFVCGSRQLVRWLVNHARPYIFSTALAPPAAAAAREALRVLGEEPDRRKGLLRLADALRQDLQGLDFTVGASRCQIVPVIVGEARRAATLARRLEREGLLVPAIRPPSVPNGSSRLRISVTAGHTPTDVERLVAGLRAAASAVPAPSGPGG